jgi:hypothetical protein
MDRPEPWLPDRLERGVTSLDLIAKLNYRSRMGRFYRPERPASRRRLLTCVNAVTTQAQRPHLSVGRPCSRRPLEWPAAPPSPVAPHATVCSTAAKRRERQEDRESARLCGLPVARRAARQSTVPESGRPLPGSGLEGACRPQAEPIRRTRSRTDCGTSSRVTAVPTAGLQVGQGQHGVNRVGPRPGFPHPWPLPSAGRHRWPGRPDPARVSARWPSGSHRANEACGPVRSSPCPRPRHR